MDSKDRKRNKSKKWFCKNAKKARRSFILAPNQKGFLISCNFREKEAIREAYVLLNEYADRLYGSEIPPAEPASDNDDEDDIDACLEAETEALKAQVTESNFPFRYLYEINLLSYTVKPLGPEKVAVIDKWH